MESKPTGRRRCGECDKYEQCVAEIIENLKDRHATPEEAASIREKWSRQPMAVCFIEKKGAKI